VKGIPFDRYLIRLRLGKTGTFHFNHGSVLHGLIKNSLRASVIPPGVIPFACESGQVWFEPSSPYNFGMTLAGDSRALFPAFLDGLRRVGEGSPDRHRPLPALGGNFVVESADRLPAPDLGAEEAFLHGRKTLEIQLLSPLRVERPSEGKRNGKAYLDPSCFDGGVFLRGLADRLEYLANNAAANIKQLSPPPIPEGLHVVPRHLLWLDVSLRGQTVSHTGGDMRGGVLGSVYFYGVSDAWVSLLVAGQYLHVGAKSRYGFGRYRIVDMARAEEAFRPARLMCERTADEATLGQALDNTVASSEPTGIDGVSARDFSGRRIDLLPSLSAEIRRGAYRPQLLRGFVDAKGIGALRPLAIPTVRDSVAQRAAAFVLGPAIDALVKDCSHLHEEGFGLAKQKCHRDGFRYELDAHMEAFLDEVTWEPLFDKLRALYPLEPLCEMIEAWVRAAVVFDGRLIERTRGLIQGCPLSPLLAKLFFAEFDQEFLGHDYRLVRSADYLVVLCRDLDSAKRARDEARLVLTRLGLSLNEDKACIRPVDSRSGYLAHLFCRSSVAEREPPKMSLPAGGTPRRPGPEPISTWLASVSLQRVPKSMEGNGGRRSDLEETRIGDREGPASGRNGVHILRRRIAGPS
jgi:hypothetical protein